MARLLHVGAAMVVAARNRLAPPTPAPAGFKATRPGEPSVVEPWFELSPRVPSVDTRVGSSAGIGVVAWLEVYGSSLGPGRPLAGASEGLEVVLAGNPVPVGTPGPDDPSVFRRHCCLRLCAIAEDLREGHQLLLVVPVRGLGPTDDATVQVFAGTQALDQPRITGDDRIALVADAPADGRFGLEVWLRLCGDHPHAAVGVRGAQGFLL
jgi:hypothetical protein